MSLLKAIEARKLTDEGYILVRNRQRQQINEAIQSGSLKGRTSCIYDYIPDEILMRELKDAGYHTRVRHSEYGVYLEISWENRK